MNFDLFKAPDPSGKMFKESYLLKFYPLEYKYIVDFCNENKLNDLLFKEKVYLSINLISEYPLCKNINCKNRVKFINSTLGYREYCSTKCVSSDPNIISIKEQKSIQKFGTKTPAESELIKDKMIKTNKIKYGGNSPMSSNLIKEKSKKTLMDNYGVDSPSRSKEILERRIESFKKSDFRTNFKKSCMEKWGVENPWMVKEIHDKSINFFYSDYRKRIESKIDSNKFIFLRFKKDISTKLVFHCHDCNNEFDILTHQFYYRNNSNVHICTNCYPISKNSSISQLELFKFIKSSYDGDVILDNKEIIKPYEIDIYLPDIKLGFEFNGVWWHSEKFKNDSYHLNKVEIANSLGIEIVTIWEDDWLTKREICESFVINKLGKIPNRIFARNCQIKQISYKDSRRFLDENHFQGDCKSSIRIGLIYDDKLVSLMTFSKLRLPLNSKNRYDRDGVFELTRFCSLINTSVVGGASKVLNYFIKNYLPNQIETYSDNLISTGKLYQSLGFEYQHTSKPGYWYLIDGIREHRFNWRKQKLVKLGFSPEKKEEEIMSELGYYRIYNAGNKKWVLKLK